MIFFMANWPQNQETGAAWREEFRPESTNRYTSGGKASDSDCHADAERQFIRPGNLIKCRE
jgi:hypothetical protein